MPIQLNNKNGTQVYHRQDDNTYKFSIFGSDDHDEINYGYVTVDNVPRNNYGFFTKMRKRPEHYYKEGITHSNTKTQAPVWTLIEVDQIAKSTEKIQNANGKPFLTGGDDKFVWPYGGNSVYLTGTFDDWQASIPMTPVSGTDINDRVFEAVVDNLDTSKDNAYKFVVDGEWCYDVQKDFVVDSLGNVNNIIYAKI